MDYPIVFILLFGFNLVNERHYLSHSVCRVECVNLLCLESIVFPCLFGLIVLSLTT